MHTHKRPVVAVYPDGQEEVFSSITEASDACGIEYPHTISNCCRGLAASAGGLAWRYKDSPLRTPDARSRGKALSVVSVHPVTGFREKYLSLSAASRAVGVTVAGISNCITVKAKTAYGLLWTLA